LGTEAAAAATAAAAEAGFYRLELPGHTT